MNDNEQQWPPLGEEMTYPDDVQALQGILSGKLKLGERGEFEPAKKDLGTWPQTEEQQAQPRVPAPGTGFDKDCYACPDCGALLLEGEMGLVCSKTWGHKGFYGRKLPKEIKVRNHTTLAFPGIAECRQATLGRSAEEGGSWVIEGVPGYFSLVKSWHSPVTKRPSEMREGDRLALDGSKVRLLRPL
jgi:hypothetical protein